MERTDEELRQAIDAMFRIRAVESPPDEKGGRTIWHRGSKGAELTSWVDATGAVYRHELSLFDDVVIWTRDGGLSTGAPKEARGAGLWAASADLTLDVPMSLERIAHAWRAMKDYRGTDRFLVHVRELLDAEHRGPFDHVVTRPGDVAWRDYQNARRKSARGGRMSLAIIGAGLAIILAALALLLLK